MKSTEKSNSPQEWSPQSQTSLKSSSSVLNNTAKEQYTSSVNTQAPPPVHPQDGFQVPWPTSWQRNSNNQDSWSSPTQRATVKPSSKHHTSTSPPSLYATPTPHWISSTSSSHATTESPRPLPPFSGCWLEKSWFWEVNSQSTNNGTSWSICSLPETLKPSDPNKSNSKEKKTKKRKLMREPDKKKLSQPQPVKKIGDFLIDEII